MILGGIVLGLIGVMAGRLLEPSLPPLIAGIEGSADAADRALEERLAAKFPAGSPEKSLVDELSREDFEIFPAERRAKWNGTDRECKRFVQIEWQAQGGTLASVTSSYLPLCS